LAFANRTILRTKRNLRGRQGLSANVLASAGIDPPICPLAVGRRSKVERSFQGFGDESAYLGFLRGARTRDV
jgi:hypothetical protein